MPFINLILIMFCLYIFLKDFKHNYKKCINCNKTMYFIRNYLFDLIYDEKNNLKFRKCINCDIVFLVQKKKIIGKIFYNRPSYKYILQLGFEHAVLLKVNNDLYIIKNVYHIKDKRFASYNFETNIQSVLLHKDEICDYKFDLIKDKIDLNKRLDKHIDKYNKYKNIL